MRLATRTMMIGEFIVAVCLFARPSSIAGSGQSTGLDGRACASSRSSGSA